MNQDARTFDDIAKDCLRNQAGFYGTARIDGTEQVNVNCMGFKAITDTVIAALANDTNDLLDFIGYAGKTITAGNDIFFGCVATKITLTSGSGEAYRSEELSLPTAPVLMGNPETAIGGGTIELNYNKLMADPTSFPEEFVVKVAGEPVTNTSVEHGTPDSQLIITLDAAIEYGDVVTLTMQSNKIKSTDGAYFAGKTDLPIKNTVPNPA